MASTSSTSSPNQCGICDEGLVLLAEDGSSFPDDVKLSCSHSYHWSCLTEAAMSKSARGRCHVCKADVLDAQDRFIVSVRNEGGFTGGFDMGEELDEIAYLEAHPEVQRSELFLALMKQSDYEDAEAMLKGDAHGKIDPNTAHREGGMTALHVAAINDDVEGIELLLRYGAERNTVTADGMTALECARASNSRHALALLSK